MQVITSNGSGNTLGYNPGSEVQKAQKLDTSAPEQDGVNAQRDADTQKAIQVAAVQSNAKITGLGGKFYALA